MGNGACDTSIMYTSKQLLIMTTYLDTGHSFVLVTWSSLSLLGVAIELYSYKNDTFSQDKKTPNHNGVICATFHHVTNESRDQAISVLMARPATLRLPDGSMSTPYQFENFCNECWVSGVADDEKYIIIN